MISDFYDMHCHLVPGVDDGAKTLGDSMELLAKEYSDGVRRIILTPHRRRKMFMTDWETVLDRFAMLYSASRKVYPDLRMKLGCEFHVHMEMEEEIAQQQFRMGSSNYLLLEFSGTDTKGKFRERVQAAFQEDCIPILAHIERYPALFGDFELIDELRHFGAKMQVNADSVIGKDGMAAKRFAWKLIKYDMLDFIGSDAHDISSRPCRMGECAALLEKKAGKGYAEHILIENPEMIWEE